MVSKPWRSGSTQRRVGGLSRCKLQDMKRAWTRGEKWLWAAPLLLGVAALATKFGPDAARRVLGWPQRWETAPGAYLTDLVASRNGEVLAATGPANAKRSMTRESGTVYLWDARTSLPIAPFTPVRASDGHGLPTYGLALSLDGKQIGFWHNSQDWRLYDIATQKPLWRFPAIVSDAEFSPEGRLLAVSNSSNVFVLNSQNGRVQSSWARTKGLIAQDLAWSPDGKIVADLGYNEVLLHRVSDGHLLRRIKNLCTSSVEFSPDGKQLLATCSVQQLLKQPSDNSSLEEWPKARCLDSTTGAVVWEVKGKQFGANVLSSVDDFCDAIFSPDGHTVVVYQAMDRRLFLIDSATGQTKETKNFGQDAEAISSAPHALAFSPDGKRLFARGQNAVLVWDLK